MAWLEAHQELRDHPKTKRAARTLGISKPQMIGHLLCLWWWCLDYAETGSLADFDNNDIADAAAWEGDPDVFVSALLNCGPADRPGFLIDTGDGLTVNDWDEYGGKYVTKRTQGRDRQRAYRQRNAAVTRDNSVSNTPREDKSREEKSTVEERREKDTTEDTDFAAAVAAWHAGGQMLSKTIADEIGLAIDDWREWGHPGYVADAITEAARSGKLNWKYVQGILKRCADEGTAPTNKHTGKNGTDPKKPIITETVKIDFGDGTFEEREVQTRGS